VDGVGAVKTLAPDAIQQVLLLGAHCDDLAIGAGGTLLALAEKNPGLQVRALVCTGAGGPREIEEQQALQEFLPEAKLSLTVLGLPDGYLPEHWTVVKQAMSEVRSEFNPDLIFAPQHQDAHQDHRTVAKLVPTVFRDHLTLGYEILKWEGDLRQPTTFHPISADVMTRKIELLHQHYPSQVGKDWFDDETFRGLARIRGAQSHTRYAEAFHVEKQVLELS
jgi:LmbE family N-acetylglucosaminyl deacetylase